MTLEEMADALTPIMFTWLGVYLSENMKSMTLQEAAESAALEAATELDALGVS